MTWLTGIIILVGGLCGAVMAIMACWDYFSKPKKLVVKCLLCNGEGCEKCHEGWLIDE